MHFWIKYANCNQAPIRTHNNTDGTPRSTPLLIVFDLIFAYQSRPGSILANTDSAMLSLHFVKGGPSIPGNKTLDTFEVTDGTYEKPFIIESSNHFYSNSSCKPKYGSLFGCGKQSCSTSSTNRGICKYGDKLGVGNFLSSNKCFKIRDHCNLSILVQSQRKSPHRRPLSYLRRIPSDCRIR